MRLTTAALIAAAVTAGTASAEEARTHDGFYLRLMAGPAYLYSDAGDDASLRGAGVGGLVVAGVTPWPGLVIGGAAMGAHIFSPTISAGGVDAEADSDAITLLVGPAIDWYPDAREGFHLLGAAGFVTLADGSADGDLGLGAGAVIGGGYDWWISERWSLGALARLQVARTSGGSDGYTSVLPVLMVTAVYH